MGTPEFAVPALQALVATQDVAGVVTQPDRPAGRGSQMRPSAVKLAAEAAGIPVYQPRSMRTEEAAGPLRDWQPDVIVVAAFGQILRPHVLSLPPHGCVNVHASLLPRWRGASPIQHAILAGDSETGITLMAMDQGLDTGPMIVSESLAIEPRETAATLHDRLAPLGGNLLRRYLDAYLEGRLAAVAQEDSKATYAPLIRKEAGAIDWRDDAATIDRLIRAMTPWPGAFTSWGDQYLRILRAEPVEAPTSSLLPGTVLATTEGPTVQTGSNGLLLREVQLAGKRAVAADEFVHGHARLIGSVLGAG